MACRIPHYNPYPPAQQPSTRSHPCQANSIIYYDKTKHELAKYFHTAAFIPVKSNFIAAINGGHYTSWPGLSASLISKHLPQSPFTVKDHLDQEQKNIRPTHSQHNFLGNVHSKQEQRTHNILSTIIDVNSATAKS